MTGEVPAGVPSASAQGAASPAGSAPSNIAPSKVAPLIKHHGTGVAVFALIAALALVADLSAGTAMVKRLGLRHFTQLLPGVAQA